MEPIAEDQELVGRAARGDDVAFELLVRRHTETVWRVCAGMLRDRALAEEAVQDTFLKAYTALGSFRGEASPRTWLVTIANRTCIDLLRRPRLEVASLDEARTKRSRDADAATRAALSMAIDSLSEEHRQAFLLVDVLGMSREEAALIAGVPASTLKSRLTRAHELLVEQIEPRRRARRSERSS